MQAGALQALVLRPRDLERALELVAGARLAHLLGDAGPEVGAETLPLAGQHPVALQVAEAAVVGDDLEPVAERLEAAAGPVAAVGALADQLPEQLGPLDRGRGRRPWPGSRSPGAVAASNRQEASRSSSVPSTWISSTAGASSPSPRRSRPRRETQSSVAAPALLQIGDPLAAPVGPVDPGDEARHHQLQLAQDHPAHLARLGQRRGHQPQHQLLVGLPGGVDPDVAEGRGREQAAEEVERLGPDRAPPGALGLLVPGASVPPPTTRPARANASRSRRARPSPPELGPELVVAVVAEAAPDLIWHRLVVGDVPSRLLEVGRESAALEDLGEDVGDPLAGDVGAADLGDRVVAVAKEDPLVEFRRPLPLGAVERALADLDVARELFEEEPAHGS